MSQKDLTRVKVLERRKAKALTQMEGAAALQVSVRQMRRLERRNESGGVTALVHGNQGKPSNRRLDGQIEARIIAKFREPGFEDYGPQLIQEEMRREGISVSRETIRKLMIREDHWSARAGKKARVHRLRKRRARRGEMLQGDGSLHAWFEDRGPPCALLCLIDDATSNMEALRFETSESLQGYQRVMEQCFREHGIPQTLYTDRHAVFKVNASGAKDHTTRFRDAMDRLGVECICANTPQAKGRVERVNRTLQDRLVKFLRHRKISDIESANAVLEEYRQLHNARFAKQPEDPQSAYVEVGDWTKIENAFTEREDRRVGKDLSVSFRGKILVLDEPQSANQLRGSAVTILIRNGTMIGMEFKGKSLRWHVYGEARPEAAPLASSKDLELLAAHSSWINRKTSTPLQRARRRAHGASTPAL